MNRCRSDTLVTFQVIVATPLSANAIADGQDSRS